MYLAAIAQVDTWQDDSNKTGWIRVIYKRELRWAKPCLGFGMAIPTQEWVERNRTRYKIWVTAEDNPTEARREDSLIYMGFYPIGGDNFVEPASRVRDGYPEVAPFEWGPWRIVLDQSTKKLQIYQITSAPGDSDVTELHFELDPTNAGILVRLNDNDLMRIAAGLVNLLADTEVRLGDGSDKVVLESLLRVFINALTVPTGMGPSGPPIVQATPTTFASSKVTTE